MDAPKLINSLNPAELGEIAGALPTDIIAEEAQRRGLFTPLAAMTAQAGGVEAELPMQEVELFETRLAQFMDPEAVVDAGEQLEVMTKFWEALGYTLPTLSKEQLEDLAWTAETNPSWRLIPAPLLGIEYQLDLVEKARAVSGSPLELQGLNFLPYASQTPEYEQLLRYPETTAIIEKTSYTLRYRSPKDDKLVGRQEFAEQLQKTGQGIVDNRGNMWVFPVMDARPRVEGSTETPQELFMKVSPVLIPEALVTLQLLHLTNGMPMGVEPSSDIANEVVHASNGKENIKYVAGVGWQDTSERINWRGWPTEEIEPKKSTLLNSYDDDKFFAARPAVSGISK